MLVLYLGCIQQGLPYWIQPDIKTEHQCRIACTSIQTDLLDSSPITIRLWYNLSYIKTLLCSSPYLSQDVLLTGTTMGSSIFLLRLSRALDRFRSIGILAL